MFRLPNNFYFAPMDDLGGGPEPIENNALDTDDAIKFMGEDSDDGETEDEPLDLTPKPVKAKETPEEPKEEESDEESEESESEEEDELTALEEELEEPTEEQLELTPPVRRKEILQKYPNLFKDFPYLEKAYYREQQYTELLPTIEDAKEAAQSRQILERFEQDLMGGDLGTVLSQVRQQDQNSFYKIMDNLLPTLAKVDNAAYNGLVGNITKYTIGSMIQEARNSGNDVLESAAQILNQFVFGNSKFQPITKFAQDEPENNEQVQEIQRREQELTQRQFQTMRTDLNTRINKTIRGSIEANIDPKGSMTDYVRKNAVREVTEELVRLMPQDKRFVTLTDKLWEQAYKNGFNAESGAKIRAAYLARAKSLLAPVIKKARNEALRGMGKRVRDSEEAVTRNKQHSSEQPRSKSSGPITKPGQLKPGERSLDFLMRD